MKPLKKDLVPAKPVKASGSKAIRAQRRKVYYATRPGITLANKKRTLSRHLRNFPEDTQAKVFYVERYREGALAAQLERVSGKARKRAVARERRIRRLAQIRHDWFMPPPAPPAYVPDLQ